MTTRLFTLLALGLTLIVPPACQSRSPTKSNPVPWNSEACSPGVNSRIRLRMSSSTSAISDRLMRGSTSCSRVRIGGQNGAGA